MQTHRVAQEVLIQAVGAEAQEVFEREVAGEGREPLPQRPRALLPDDGRPAVEDACAQGLG